MKNINKNKIAIVTMSSFVAISYAVSPIIQKMIEAFPETDPATIRLVSTLPALAASIVLFIVGSIVGNVISFKAVVSAGLLCLFVGGCGPYFFHSSIYVILGFRFVFGIGLGCIAIRNAVIVRSFDAQECTKLMGLSVFAMNAGNMITVKISGLLGDIHWTYSFLLYILCFVGFLIFFVTFTEPERPEGDAEKKYINPVSLLFRLDKRVWLYMVILFLLTGIKFPMTTGISSYISENGFGGASESSTAVVCYTVGGMLAGAVFAWMTKVFGDKLFSLANLGLGLGFGLLAYHFSFITVEISCFLIGFFYFFINLIFSRYAGIVSDKTTKAFATSLCSMMCNLGAYISNAWISTANFLGGGMGRSELSTAYFVSGAVYLLLAVVTFFMHIRPKEAQEG